MMDESSLCGPLVMPSSPYREPTDLTPFAKRSSRAFFEEIVKQETTLSELSRRLEVARSEGEKLKCQALETVCCEEMSPSAEEAPTMAELHQLLDAAGACPRRRRRSKSCDVLQEKTLSERLKARDEEIMRLREEVATLRALKESPLNAVSPSAPTERGPKIIEFEALLSRHPSTDSLNTVSTLDDDEEDSTDEEGPLSRDQRRTINKNPSFIFCGAETTTSYTENKHFERGYALFEWLFTEKNNPPPPPPSSSSSSSVAP